PEDIQRAWLEGVETVGLSAGASAPEVLVENVIRQLQDWGAETVEEDSGQPETVVFALPKNLLGAMAGR
ncbi:MAG: 4-hydroxy-3-methylbut-2-enyl diphosphate reductase, partial [Sedimenticolaceae bacterium]